MFHRAAGLPEMLAASSSDHSHSPATAVSVRMHFSPAVASCLADSGGAGPAVAGHTAMAPTHKVSTACNLQMRKVSAAKERTDADERRALSLQRVGRFRQPVQPEHPGQLHIRDRRTGPTSALGWRERTVSTPRRWSDGGQSIVITGTRQQRALCRAGRNVERDGASTPCTAATISAQQARG